MATPVLRAIEWDGTSWDEPSDDQLHDLLADMSLTWRFVVVQRLDIEPAGQHYMQVYLNDDLSYRLEYRDGGPDRLFHAHVPRTHEAFRSLCSPLLKCFRTGPTAGRAGVKHSPGRRAINEPLPFGHQLDQAAVPPRVRHELRPAVGAGPCR
jgi:hypothetical protein